MNAHINHDLPVAVVSTCTQLATSPAAGAHLADYQKVDQLLDAAEQSVRQSFESAPELAVDHHLQAVNNLIASWTINSARDLAWRNALLLWELRDIPVARGLFLDSLACRNSDSQPHAAGGRLRAAARGQPSPVPERAWTCSSGSLSRSPHELTGIGAARRDTHLPARRTPRPEARTHARAFAPDSGHHPWEAWSHGATFVYPCAGDCRLVLASDGGGAASRGHHTIAPQLRRRQSTASRTTKYSILGKDDRRPPRSPSCGGWHKNAWAPSPTRFPAVIARRSASPEALSDLWAISTDQ